MTFATATIGAQTDGLPYATGAVMTTSEASLFNQTPPGLLDPVPLPYEAAVAAVVEMTVTGTPDATSAYVVAQTDLGDGVWLDVAWCLCTATSGTVTFLLSAGVAGAGVFQQTRAAGTAPGSSGANQCVLGGRIRFVGKATFTNGTSPKVTVTIRYRLLGLR